MKAKKQTFCNAARMKRINILDTSIFSPPNFEVGFLLNGDTNYLKETLNWMKDRRQTIKDFDNCYFVKGVYQELTYFFRNVKKNERKISKHPKHYNHKKSQESKLIHKIGTQIKRAVDMAENRKIEYLNNGIFDFEYYDDWFKEIKRMVIEKPSIKRDKLEEQNGRFTDESLIAAGITCSESIHTRIFTRDSDLSSIAKALELNPGNLEIYREKGNGEFSFEYPEVFQ